MRVFKFLTDYIQILNILITIVSIVAAEIHVFRGDYSRSTLVWINAYIFVWLLYLVCKFSCELDDGDWGFWEDISCSFAMISICGIVARVVLFFFCDSSELVQFYLFLTFNALSIRFYIPVLLSRKYSTLPYTKNGSIIVWITAILFVALLIFLFIAAGYPKSFNEIMIFQLYYSFFTASYIDYKIYSIVTIEDYNELRAQVYQYVSVLLVRERPAPPPRPSFSDVVRIHSSPGEPAPKCQVCFLPFSAQVIPRILTTCAHTLCQNCIGRIMDENDRVCCPVCQEVTVVYGSVESLLRNFALLELTGPQ